MSLEATPSPAPAAHTSRFNITVRTALLAWLVAIATLAIFASAVVPEQKRSYLENLRSKAHGVSVSLRDLAASAVVNEDYSSVVDHCTEMLRGDSAISYIVFTRNDGFSLVHDHAGWRITTLSGPWRPARRQATSGIEIVPYFERRVFQFSQPFDYSGIEWGWIHIGLSLDAYDRSVAEVNRRTFLLGLASTLLGLAASIVYAKHLVRPLLHLQATVRQVAGGDLSARTSVERTDELGSLAQSIDSMTEALLRRDRILASVQFAAQQFLSTSDWRTVIDSVLARLGDATGATRIQLVTGQLAADGRVDLQTLCRWLSPDAPAAISTPHHPTTLDLSPTFKLWVESLHRAEIVSALARELPPPVRDLLASFGIKSTLVIPVFVESQLWGCLSLHDCFSERRWTSAECASLRAAADMLGAAIARQHTQDALVDAKKTLEQRVAERTQALREEGAAKDHALAELAQTQQRLVQLSREAGMAEVATGVLHNVGNVLNSVNVSATLIRDRLAASEADTLVRVASLLQQHASDLPAYLATDPKGRLVPALLHDLAAQLAAEQRDLLREHELLSRNVEHIKEIVAMQQSYARLSGVIETLSLVQLVDDALQINSAGLVRHGVRVERHFEKIPLVTLDKHKVLQILVNLVRNAKYALDQAAGPDRLLQVEVRAASPGRVQVVVRDNGVGIPAENLTRIFSHGFTTRRDGHGFGLHSGANAAREMGGQLTAASPGPGQGATFTLELPLSFTKAKS